MSNLSLGDTTTRVGDLVDNGLTSSQGVEEKGKVGFNLKFLRSCRVPMIHLALITYFASLQQIRIQQ
jgi:hypothetical protein